ncbi:MAG: hypothetical protein ACIAQF_02305 [Phycisphaerales bacterium JB065]
MTPPRFSDEELLALIEGELDPVRADALRDAVRDGDLELASRLIDMAEHREFLQEMKIDRADLNPDSATTPEGIVSAAIAAAERESLVPAQVESESGKRAWWVGPLAAGVGIAALVAVGVVISRSPVSNDRGRLPADIEQQIADGKARVVSDDDELPQELRDREAIRRLAQDLFPGSDPDPGFTWPAIDGDDRPGIDDPFHLDPVEIAGSSGLSEVMTEQEIATAMTVLQSAGVKAESADEPIRFAGIDPLGIERDYTLDEAAALAKAGRLAIEVNTPDQSGLALTGGYLADTHQRYSVFATALGSGGPDEVEQFRATERVTGLTGRVGEAIGMPPEALASYSFEAEGSPTQVNDLERATMLELIAAVVSPMNSGPGRSRLRLIELPFDASDEPTVIEENDGEDPFWWLQPETDYSKRGTALIPVVVK